MEGKKLRLVLDLRHVNHYLVKPKFRYEDIRSLSQVLEENSCFFFTWDLKSDHHVDILEDHWKYLGFAWLFGTVTRYFTFCVLLFGLSTACFCFTKLMRPLVKRRRSMAHTTFIYLDDGFGSQRDRISACAIQHKELQSSGLLCNEEKSHWDLGNCWGFDQYHLDEIPNSRKETCKIEKSFRHLHPRRPLHISLFSQDCRVSDFACARSRSHSTSFYSTNVPNH